MFSANENLILREYKRRVVGYIESTIPEHALDMGTSVMVMQTACKTPGCVPLETAVVIVFPRIKNDTTLYIDGVAESCGGTFKTKILMPLSDVTLDDVLDALPPGFKGGRKTFENTCLNLRDLVLGRLGGTVGTGDTDIEVEERKILSEYLIASLRDYIDNKCVAPPLGMAFPEKEKSSDSISNSSASPLDTGNDDLVNVADVTDATDATDATDTTDAASPISSTDSTIQIQSDSDEFTKEKQVVVKQDKDNNDDKFYMTKLSSALPTSTPSEIPNTKGQEGISAGVSQQTLNTKKQQNQTESAMDWRRRQNMSKSLDLPDSNTMIQRLAGREQIFCMRNASCPCCDIDPFDIDNTMMSL